MLINILNKKSRFYRLLSFLLSLNIFLLITGISFHYHKVKCYRNVCLIFYSDTEPPIHHHSKSHDNEEQCSICKFKKAINKILLVNLFFLTLFLLTFIVILLFELQPSYVSFNWFFSRGPPLSV